MGFELSTLRDPVRCSKALSYWTHRLSECRSLDKLWNWIMQSNDQITTATYEPMTASGMQSRMNIRDANQPPLKLQKHDIFRERALNRNSEHNQSSDMIWTHKPSMTRSQRALVSNPSRTQPSLQYPFSAREYNAISPSLWKNTCLQYLDLGITRPSSTQQTLVFSSPTSTTQAAPRPHPNTEDTDSWG